MPIREQARARARAARCGRPGACQPSGALTRGAPGSVVANFSPLPEDATELRDGDLVKMCAFASRLPMQRRRHPLVFCMFGLPGRTQQCAGLRPTQQVGLTLVGVCRQRPGLPHRRLHRHGRALAAGPG